MREKWWKGGEIGWMGEGMGWQGDLGLGFGVGGMFGC